MEFLTQRKRSVVVQGERIFEDDPRYKEITAKSKPETKVPETAAATVNESKTKKSPEEIARDEQFKQDWSKIRSCFTVKLFVKIALWVALFYWLGPLSRPALVFVTFFYLIFSNLGQRKEGELSAYSVFNPNFERLEGDNLAEQFEAQLRHVPVEQVRGRNRAQRAAVGNRNNRARTSAAFAADDDSDEENINKLKPRDKVIIAKKQGKFNI